VTNTKEVSQRNNISGYYLKPSQAFGINDKIISDNIIFINQTKLLFISGCNLVIHDIVTNETNFILRDSPLFCITSMSVGHRSEKDTYICLGEYNTDSNKNQISVINIFDNNIQYVLSNKDSRGQNWKIILARILKNSANCVSIAKKDLNNNQTKIAFWKYTQELFIAEAIIDEDIKYFSYNPKNTYELVVCGKNYLRLWNVFINQGILREHPQRFLKSKQEKDFTFINIDFFERKAFTFIVGTMENIIFVIEGFIVLAEINCGISKENIYELNLQNQFTENDQSSDEILYGTKPVNANKSINSGNLNSLYNENNKNKNLYEDSNLDNNKIRNSHININNNQILHKTKNNFYNPDENTFNQNPILCVRILGNSQILVTFQYDSLTYIYNKMERDIRNASIKKEDLPGSEETKLNSKNKNAIQDEIKVDRLANNIKQIINVSVNDDGSKIIYFVEVFCSENKNETTLRLLLFNKKGNSLIFEKEVFRNFLNKFKIKKFGINEIKQVFFTINENNDFRCFDFKNYKFQLQHHFNEEPLEVISCPNNNIIGISFSNKFSLFFLLKDKIVPFMDFDIILPNGKFSEKGEFLAISGCNPNTKLYSILFFETFNFNILHAIENVKNRVKKFIFKENDKYLFILFENGLIRGFILSLDYLSINLIQRYKDRSKPVNNAFINLFYKHHPKGDYHDFDYDYKYDLLVIIMRNSEKVIE